MNKAFIRPIRAQDNAAIAGIIRLSMAEFGAVGPGYSSEDAEIDRMYEAYQEAGRAGYYVLEIEGRVVGGGGIGPLAEGDPQVCELRKMYFLPEARGRGWGRRMVEQCLEAARRLGYTRCYLETLERMEAANLLYLKMGFRALCNRLGDTGHCGCDRYFVREI